MTDIVERLRRANTSLNEGDCCGQLDASGTCMAPACIFGEALKMAYEAADEITRLRARNAELVAALENVMVGGNHLALIIGAEHPPHGTPHEEARAHYEGGMKYEAWCCWNSIMQACAALKEKQ